MLNDVCDGKGFSRARNSKKNLVFCAIIYSFCEFFDCLGLISGRLKFRFNFKVHGHVIVSYGHVAIMFLESVFYLFSSANLNLHLIDLRKNFYSVI